MTISRFLLLFSIFIAFPTFAFEGKVISIHDGDSIKVLNENNSIEAIRIYRIDSPELKSFRWGAQPYAEGAKSALVALCSGEIAMVTRVKKDRYSRTIGNVSCKGLDVGTFMLTTGNAWAYRYTSTVATRALQENAKKKKIGLWALTSPVEPIIWRKYSIRPPLPQ